MIKKNKEQDTNFELRTIKSLKDYIFLVEDYQRGYQWESQQVLDLLRDIEEFNPSKSAQEFYCLQPVAVKQIMDGQLTQLIIDEQLENAEFETIYELVDGQQRLTTIFLILRLLTEENHHTIIYRTRPQSKKYLEKIKNIPLTSNINTRESIELLDEQLNVAWENYISNHPSFDNVDNYHFYKASQIILNYPFEDKEIFLSKIFNSTQVIWYNEIHKSTKKLFADLNSGKIRLTGAELIKALFVLNLSSNHSTSSEIAQFKTNELATEWDDIEYTLQQSDFWYFIKGKTKRNYTSRIGYLFDVLCDATQVEDDLHTYRMYADQKKKLDWDELKSFFQKLVEWYNDPFIYHRIGFLIFQNDNKLNSLERIREKSARLTKGKFKKTLDEEITNAFAKIKKGDSTKFYDIDNLSYSNNKKQVTDTLILFNICLYENLISDYRINFKEFYDQNWTLEHIFPQNFADIESPEEAIEFLKDYNQLLERDSEDKNRCGEFLIQLKDMTVPQFAKLKNAIVEFIAELISKMNLDQIENLTLLHQSENSSIGNKPFESKRAEIISFSQKNQSQKGNTSFIPLGTLHVFTKFYSVDADKLQLSHWSQYDKEKYKEAMSNVLKKYLPN